MMPSLTESASESSAVRSRIARRALQSRAQWFAITGLAILVLGMVYYGIGNNRWKLLAAATTGCIVCVVTYLAGGRLTPRYYGPRLLIVSYGLQFLALAAIAALGLPLSPQYHPFEVNAGDNPVRAVLAMLTVPVGALVAATVWRFVSRSSGPAEHTAPREDVARQRRPYLVMAAVVHLLFWPAALENSGAVGYATRILAAALVASPFLAGRDSRRDRGLVALWSLTILLNAGIGLAAGTRSKAFVAAVLFVAGYISALPKGRRIAAGVCAVVAMVPLIQLAGAAGLVRNDLGRGLELVQPDHIREVFRQLSREMMPGNQSNAEDVKIEGVSRLLAWTNVVVPLMTPEAVPYRGLDGVLAEAAQTFRIASMSGLTPDDLYDAGLLAAPARLYGFTINSNTAVDFTLAADAWSRGGAPVALLFSFIAGLALIAGELCAYRLHRYGTGVATVLALPVASAAFFDANAVPLLAALRVMVMNLFVVAIGVAIIELIRHEGRNAGRRRVNGPLRSAKVGYRRG